MVISRNLKKVFIVFKTHFDIGYTHLAKELLEWYSDGMIRDVAEICKATSDCPEGRKYVWTVPSWPLKKTVEGIKDTELKETVEKFIRDKQLVWHGLPFTTHTEFYGLEEFIRGLYTGCELSEKYGRWTTDAKMTDVPGHTWILPTILAKAGIKFIHLGSNFCATPPDVPRLFFWEGPDGSKVLTYYSKGDYGTDLVPPKDWDYPYWLAMLQTLDNLGAQDTGYLEKLFERAEKEMPGTEVSVGTLEDFGKAVLESGCEIPVVKGDMADTWIRGIGSAPVGVSRVRRQRPLLSTLESVTAFKKMNGLYKNAEEQEKDSKTVAACYEKMLLFGEHTWSMDTKVTILPERIYGAPWIGFKFWESGIYSKEVFETLKGNDPGYLKLQESWQEQLDYIKAADEGIERLKGKALDSTAASVDVEGERIFLASNLGWETKSRIKLDDVLPDDKKIQFLEDVDSGEKLIIYLDHEGNKCADITAPPLGYKTIKIPRGVGTMTDVADNSGIAHIDGSRGILENDFIKVEVDGSTGCIKSLYHKPVEKEWVNNKSERGFGQYFYDIFSSEELNRYLCDYCYVLRDWAVNDTGKAGYPKDQKHQKFVSAGFDLEAENGYNWGKITASARINDESVARYGNALQIKVSITICQGSDYVDLRYDLLNKQATPLIESGHFSFPFALDNPKYRINKSGCVIDPEKDVMSGCNKDLHCLEKWVDVSDGNCGLAIISYDMPLFSFNEPGVLKYHKHFAIKEPTLLMQAFNNAWGTNFPQWISGDLCFRYRLVPHKGDWMEGKVWKLAEESVKKPVIAFAGKQAMDIKAPIICNILGEDLDGFNILAFKPAKDGKGYILRIGEIKGLARMARLQLSLPIIELWACDLIERKQVKMPFVENNGKRLIEFKTEAFGIHTFYMMLESK